MEDVELLVDLHELEGAASPPPLLLGFPVVDVLGNRRADQRVAGTVRGSEAKRGRGRSWVRRKETEVAYPLVFGGLSHGDEEPSSAQERSGAAEADGGVRGGPIGDDDEEGGATGGAARRG